MIRNLDLALVLLGVSIGCGCSSGPSFPDAPPEYYKFTTVNGLQVLVDYPGYSESEESASLAMGRIDLRAERGEDGSEKTVRFKTASYQLYVDADLSGDASESEVLERFDRELTLPTSIPAREWPIPLDGPVIVHFEFDDGNGNVARMNLPIERVDYQAELEGVERTPMSDVFDVIDDAHDDTLDRVEPHGSMESPPSPE